MEKAIEIVNSQNIDLILLDVENAQFNGYEVYKILKTSDKTKIFLLFLLQQEVVKLMKKKV